MTDEKKAIGTIEQMCERRGIPLDSLDVHQKLTLAHQHSYLIAFAHNGNQSKAALEAGVSRGLPTYWIKENVLNCNDDMALAVDNFCDGLEQMIMDRLRDPAGNRGSDILLMFMVKGQAKLHRYRDSVTLQVDDTPKVIAAKLAGIAVKSAEMGADDEKLPATERSAQITALERMRAEPEAKGTGTGTEGL